MRIVVMSDTHVGDRCEGGDYVLNRVEELRPNMIIHAGDLTSEEFLEALRSVAPTIAVRGNADTLELPEERTLEVGGIRIGILHGHQFLSLNSHFLALKALDMGVDLLVFGHTHRFYLDSISLHGRGVHLLNPGSPTLPRFDDPSIAVLRVVNGELDVERVKMW